MTTKLARVTGLSHFGYGPNQLSLGNWQSSREISSVPRTPLIVYAIVTRTGMNTAENFTVLPTTVWLWRAELEEDVCDVSGSEAGCGHFASRAEAATTSTPTYANVAIEMLILRHSVSRVEGEEGSM